VLGYNRTILINSFDNRSHHSIEGFEGNMGLKNMRELMEVEDNNQIIKWVNENNEIKIITKNQILKIL